MKKVLSIVLSIAMVVCLAPTMAFAGTTTAASNAAYSDIEGTACEGAVNVLSALGVVDGFTDGTYKPEQTVTRAQMAKLVVTALGVADYATATTSKFVDMGTATWAIPYVEYASNLNIVNGVGNGKFNPNGLVTYEQAATMIVRAIGYTDACNEMNGIWPAIYIQKAMALGIFEGVENGGAKGATRGDIAIMLYNALDVVEVYADNDGATHEKYDADGVGVTMMDTLNNGGDSAYGTITSTQVENAKLNIRAYLGAAGKYTYNKHGDILALGDIKSEFITGDINSEGKLDVDGTVYTINDDALAILNDKGGIQSIDKTTALIENGKTSDDSASISTADIKEMEDETVTLAAEVSGKTIKHIFSVATWDAGDNTAKISDADLAQITKNKKLLSVKFDKDDNGDIDTTTFILNGVASLSDIAEDNIVYVYAKGGDGNVARIDVGTKVVSGEITKTTSKKVTIDGVDYKFVDESKINELHAGDKVTLYLDYDGKVYEHEIDEATSGDYALLINASDEDEEPSDNAIKSDAKVQLFTADGNATVYSVNGKKYAKNVSDGTADSWLGSNGIENSAVTSSAVDKIRIIKFSVSDGKVTKLQLSDTIKSNDAKLDVLSGTDAKITKNGYLSYGDQSNTLKLSDSIKIFAAPYNNDNFEFDDTDDLSVLTKSDVLDSDINAYQAVINKEKSEVVALLIDNDTTSDYQYGIATGTASISVNGSAKDGVSFYIGSTEYTDQELGDVAGNSLKIMNKTTAYDADVLYRIKKTTAGKYSFESVASSKKQSTTAAGIKSTGSETKVDKISSERVTLSDDTSLNIASNVVIYTYDISADKTTVSDYSSRLDLISEDVNNVTFYKNVDSDSDNYGLVDYIVIYQK